MIDAHNYAYITCTNLQQGRRLMDLNSKLIHKDDVQFYLQSLQIAYPKYTFKVHNCTP